MSRDMKCTTLQLLLDREPIKRRYPLTADQIRENYRRFLVGKLRRLVDKETFQLTKGMSAYDVSRWLEIIQEDKKMRKVKGI